VGGWELVIYDAYHRMLLDSIVGPSGSVFLLDEFTICEELRLDRDIGAQHTRRIGAELDGVHSEDYRIGRGGIRSKSFMCSRKIEKKYPFDEIRKKSSVEWKLQATNIIIRKLTTVYAKCG
jgi:hypothetical protein